MGVKIISIYTKKEDIDKIIDKIKNYDFSSLKKSSHFEFSILEKNTNIEKIEEVFPMFELIKSVELRENEKGQRHYGFNYELEDETYIVIAISFESEPPTVINGFHANKNYKRFEKSLRKNYGSKFI